MGLETWEPGCLAVSHPAEEAGERLVGTRIAPRTNWFPNEATSGRSTRSPGISLNSSKRLIEAFAVLQAVLRCSTTAL